jgi:hypothetical protein
MDHVQDPVGPGKRQATRQSDFALDVIIPAVVGSDVDENAIRVLGVDRAQSARAISLGLVGVGIVLDQAEPVIRKILLHVQDDLFLDFRDRQPGDLDVSIETQADGAVGPDQPLAGDGPAGEGLEHFDQEQVRRFHHVH